MKTDSDYPLFPLRAVLMPGGRLPLQIFEPRYLDLVSRSMREDVGFGIVRIKAGSEVVTADNPASPTLESIGTEARIVDWDALPHGRLKIVVEGGRRFRLRDSAPGPQHLTLGQVEWLPEPVPSTVVSEYTDSLQALMVSLAEHEALRELGVANDPVPDSLLAWQLAQYLPIDEATRYAILVEEDPARRLEQVEFAVQALSGEAGHGET